MPLNNKAISLAAYHTALIHGATWWWPFDSEIDAGLYLELIVFKQSSQKFSGLLWFGLTKISNLHGQLVRAWNGGPS